MEMNFDRGSLILIIGINFWSCDRLNLIGFLKIWWYVRVKLNENENEIWESRDGFGN